MGGDDEMGGSDEMGGNDEGGSDILGVGNWSLGATYSGGEAAVAVILFLFVIGMYAAILFHLLVTVCILQARPIYPTFAAFIWWTVVVSGVELLGVKEGSAKTLRTRLPSGYSTKALTERVYRSNHQVVDENRW